MSPEMQNIVMFLIPAYMRLLVAYVPVRVQRPLAPEEPGEGHRNSALAGGEEERDGQQVSRVMAAVI